MNKSLELIKSEIYEAKSNLQKFTDLLKKEPENEGHSFFVRYFTNRLTILQQIKSELEAWEIVKSKEVDLYDVIHTTDYEQYKLENEDLLEQYILDLLEYGTIKKALEVEE